MQSQNQLKDNNYKRNVKRAAKINYLLKINGFTQTAVAKNLDVSQSAVYRVINGLMKSRKINDWLKENLGI